MMRHGRTSNGYCASEHGEQSVILLQMHSKEATCLALQMGEAVAHAEILDYVNRGGWVCVRRSSDAPHITFHMDVSSVKTL